jgi:hypothetical protein
MGRHPLSAVRAIVLETLHLKRIPFPLRTIGLGDTTALAPNEFPELQREFRLILLEPEVRR